MIEPETNNQELGYLYTIITAKHLIGQRS